MFRHCISSRHYSLPLLSSPLYQRNRRPQLPRGLLPSQKQCAAGDLQNENGKIAQNIFTTASRADSSHEQRSSDENLKNQFRQLLKNHNELIKKNDEVLEDNRVFRDKIQVQKRQLGAKDHQNHKLEKRIQTLEKTIKSHEKIIKSLEKIIKSHEKTIKSHEKTIKSHEKTIKSHEKTIKSHEKTIKSHEETIRSLRSKITSLETENKELQMALSGSNEALHKIRRRIILDEARQLILLATGYRNWQDLRRHVSRHKLKNLLSQSNLFVHPPLSDLAVSLIYDSDHQVWVDGNRAAHEASEQLLRESLVTANNRQRPAMGAILDNLQFWNQKIKQRQTVPRIRST